MVFFSFRPCCAGVLAEYSLQVSALNSKIFLNYTFEGYILLCNFFSHMPEAIPYRSMCMDNEADARFFIGRGLGTGLANFNQQPEPKTSVAISPT